MVCNRCIVVELRFHAIVCWCNGAMVEGGRWKVEGGFSLLFDIFLTLYSVPRVYCMHCTIFMLLYEFPGKVSNSCEELSSLRWVDLHVYIYIV